MPTIDLNADLGEGFGVWRMGDDAAMLRVVTSANIACGFHAGDPDIMANCFEQAKALGVAVGAHVSFPDLAGFGRRALPMSIAEIERAVAYQLGAATAVARYVGHEITFVKAHGALANLAERDAEIAERHRESRRRRRPLAHNARHRAQRAGRCVPMRENARRA